MKKLIFLLCLSALCLCLNAQAQGNGFYLLPKPQKLATTHAKFNLSKV